MEALLQQGGFDGVALQWVNSALLLALFALVSRRSAAVAATGPWRRARLWMLVSITVVALWFYVVPSFLPEIAQHDPRGHFALSVYLFSKCAFWLQVAAGAGALNLAPRPERPLEQHARRRRWPAVLLGAACVGAIFASPSIEAATFFQAAVAVPALLVGIRHTNPMAGRDGEPRIALLRLVLATTAIVWTVYLAAFFGPTLGLPSFTHRPFAVLWLPNAYLDTLLDSVLTIGMIVAVLERSHLDAQRASEARIARVSAQQATIVELAKAEEVAAGDVGAAVRRATQAAANTLGVDRVSVWEFDEDRTHLECRDLFVRASGRHTSGPILSAANYPRYFASLEAGRSIAIADVTTDPRTRELLDPYLTPTGVRSLLDVAVRSATGVIGVVCHEHTGSARRWHDDEIAFAGFIADLVSQANANCRAREAEQQQRELERQLRHSQKLDAVGHLAGGIAHDFNNLLCAIMGFASLMRGDGTPQSKECLSQIQDAARRAAELTGKLLSFSRRQVLHPKVVELDEVVGAVESLVRRVTPANIQVVADRAQGPGRVLADRSELEHVVLNLANNAADAMPSGGTLTLETRLMSEDERAQHTWAADGDWAAISVIDTGSGIPPELQERVFEPYFTTKPEGQGTGLGLATSYGIVAQHGGRMTLHSVPGQGSRFDVWLPVVETPPTPPEPTPPPLAHGGVETVLVVEDDARVRSLVDSVLTDAGYSVLLAATGELGLDAFKARHASIDLVLMDMALPGRPGLEVLSEMRAVAKELPAVVTSGINPDLNSEVLGVTLPKPFSNAELLHAIRAALDARPAR